MSSVRGEEICLRSSTIHSRSHVSLLSLKDKDVSVTPLLDSANNVWHVAILRVGLPARVDARAPIGGIHPHHGCIELKHGSRQACFPKINRTYKQHCAGATTFSETTLQQDLVLCSDFYVSSGLRYLWRPVCQTWLPKAGVMSSELPSSRCSPGALLRMQLNLQMCSIVSKTRLRFRFTDNNMDELFSVGRHIFLRNVT